VPPGATDDVEGTVDHAPDASAPTGSSRTWHALRADRGFWIGVVILGVIVGASLLAPVISPYDPDHEFRELMPLDGSALPPSAQFLLGTDVSGHDYLTRLLYAGRATLLVGFGANLAAITLGAVVGLVAGYSATVSIGLGRGRSMSLPLETILMRITDIGLAFPVLLFAIAATAVLGQSLWLVACVIAAVLWTTTARLVYARALRLRSADFITASRALGVSGPRIIRTAILPHVLPLIIVLASLGVAATILFEASLSFVGAGAPVGTPTWGRLLADGVSWYRTDPRLPLLPGLLIFLVVLACNLIGDALGEALDPRGRHR